MTAFLCTYLVLVALSLICSVSYLATGKVTTITPGTRAVSILINIGFLVWASLLLISGAAA